MSQALDRSLVAVDHLLVEVVAVGARLMVEVVAVLEVVAAKEAVRLRY